jgi:hypothetical protein
MTRYLFVVTIFCLSYSSCKKSEVKPPIDNVIGSYTGQVVEYHETYSGRTGVTETLDTSYYETVQTIVKVGTDSFRYEPDATFATDLTRVYQYIEIKDSVVKYEDYDGLNGYAQGIRVFFPAPDSMVAGWYSRGGGNITNRIFRGKKIKK